MEPGGGVVTGFFVGFCCGVVTPGVLDGGVGVAYGAFGSVGAVGFVLGFVVLGFVLLGFVVVGSCVVGVGAGVVGVFPRSFSDEPGGFAFVGSAGA